MHFHQTLRQLAGAKYFFPSLMIEAGSPFHMNHHFSTFIANQFGKFSIPELEIASSPVDVETSIWPPVLGLTV